jgi:hypothetical protein
MTPMYSLWLRTPSTRRVVRRRRLRDLLRLIRRPLSG